MLIMEKLINSAKIVSVAVAAAIPDIPTWAIMIVLIAVVGIVYWFVKIRPNKKNGNNNKHN